MSKLTMINGKVDRYDLTPAGRSELGISPKKVPTSQLDATRPTGLYPCGHILINDEHTLKALASLVLNVPIHELEITRKDPDPSVKTCDVCGGGVGNEV